LALLAGIATLALVIRAVCFLAAQVTLPLAAKQKKKPSQHGTPEQERAMTDETCCGACGYPVHATKEMACDWCRQAADRIEALTAKLARAEWLLTDAAVQLEEGKIKTRRNRAGLIWQFLEEIKGT
jgi:hypothetical protein